MTKKNSFLLEMNTGLLILLVSFLSTYISRAILSIFVKTPNWYQNGGDLTKLYSFTCPFFGFVMLLTTVAVAFFIFKYVAKNRTYKEEKVTDKKQLIISSLVITIVFTIIRLFGICTNAETYLATWFCYITGVIDASILTTDTNTGNTALVFYGLILSESLILYFIVYLGKKSGENNGIKARQLNRQKLIEKAPILK